MKIARDISNITYAMAKEIVRNPILGGPRGEDYTFEDGKAQGYVEGYEKAIRVMIGIIQKFIDSRYTADTQTELTNIQEEIQELLKEK